MFLTATQVVTDFAGAIPPPVWRYRSSWTECWFEPAGVLNGRVVRDENQNMVRDPGEIGIGGDEVKLYDADGNYLDTTYTAADGTYEFGGMSAGTYQVHFQQPAGLRPDRKHMGTNPYLDSDYDMHTLIAAVTLDEDRPTSDGRTDALFRPLVANDDFYNTPYQTPVSGNVLDNDPTPDPADGLVVSVYAPPSHGMLVLNADGTFTYTPGSGFYGYDTFVYLVTDAYGVTATATVTIHVGMPPLGDHDTDPTG